MFHLKDNFRANAPISQVPASWFNAVASFLNNLIGGYGIKINKNGPFPVVSINPDVLLGNDSNGAKKVDLAKSVGYEPMPEEESENDKSWVIGAGTATLQVISRVVSVGGVAYRLHIREMAVGADGRIKSISKEKGFFEIVSL